MEDCWKPTGKYSSRERKTTREQVKAVYSALAEKYPNFQALASASAGELEEILKPLGIQKKRSRLLIKAASFISEKYGGAVPRDFNALKKIPGVGQYTANAVLCLAWNEDLPLVDTNFIRVLQRVFAVKSDKARARTDGAVWSFARSLIPPGRGREFNLSLLDFANLVCTPRAPKCSACPVRALCCYYKAGGHKSNRCKL